MKHYIINSDTGQCYCPTIEREQPYYNVNNKLQCKCGTTISKTY